MRGYIERELPALIAAEFPADISVQSIMGHSMGGHGALTIALRNSGKYRSVSAFSPIVAPTQVPWGQKALSGYLGPDQSSWRQYDAVALIEDGARVPDILVDQGRCRPVSRRTVATRVAEGGVRYCIDPAYAASAAGLRSQLLFHLDLHGRSSALARRTVARLNLKARSTRSRARNSPKAVFQCSPFCSSSTLSSLPLWSV